MWSSKSSFRSRMFVLVGVAVSTVSVSAMADTGGVPELRRDLAALQQVVTGLTAELAATKADLAETQTDLAEIQTDLAETQAELESTQALCEEELGTLSSGFGTLSSGFGTLSSGLQTTSGNLDSARSFFLSRGHEAAGLAFSGISSDLGVLERETLLLDFVAGGVPASGEGALEVLERLYDVQALFAAGSVDPLIVELGHDAEWNQTAERIQLSLDEYSDRVSAGESILLSSATRDLLAEISDSFNTVGDDEQLANLELQNMLAKQQQALQMMSNISKQMHDTANSVLGNIR